MKTLTLKQLEEMQPGIFAKGEVIDSPEGCNVANTGRTIKWVAVRGSIADWCIYTDNPYRIRYSFESVRDMGDKIHDGDNIKKLVPCDDEAFNMYRI